MFEILQRSGIERRKHSVAGASGYTEYATRHDGGAEFGTRKAYLHHRLDTQHHILICTSQMRPDRDFVA
ncbi:MAG TPA: hypothetical protein ENJ00_09740 [Phycisphaerales bacterium]|nr:hypothetical protein [Phycisphaerales bacterium]